MQIVLNTHGLSLRVKDKVFYVSSGDESYKISPERVSSILVTAPCSLSSAAIMLAAQMDIPIYFFDRIGDAQACLRSPYFESLATLRRRQVYFSDSPAGSAWVLEQFKLKTEQQLQLLRLLRRRRPGQEEMIVRTMEALLKAVEQLPEVEGPPCRAWNARLMGWEGNQGRRYWKCLGNLMPECFAFSGRSRRPAKDWFNAMLNYGYGILYNLVERAIFAAGLDPHLGILHVDQYDRPTLAYDLIEPFRPWIDRFVVDLALSGQIEEDHFDAFAGGYYLSTNGKRLFIPLFNEWMQVVVRWGGRQQKREAHVFRSAEALAKHIRQTVKRPER